MTNVCHVATGALASGTSEREVDCETFGTASLLPRIREAIIVIAMMIAIAIITRNTHFLTSVDVATVDDGTILLVVVITSPFPFVDSHLPKSFEHLWESGNVNGLVFDSNVLTA